MGHWWLLVDKKHLHLLQESQSSPFFSSSPSPRVKITGMRAKPLFSQTVDRGTDFKSWTQLDIHGGDEMILTQQQERLPIDFLRQEVGSQLFTT